MFRVWFHFRAGFFIMSTLHRIVCTILVHFLFLLLQCDCDCVCACSRLSFFLSFVMSSNCEMGAIRSVFGHFICYATISWICVSNTSSIDEVIHGNLLIFFFSYFAIQLINSSPNRRALARTDTRTDASMLRPNVIFTVPHFYPFAHIINEKFIHSTKLKRFR